VKLPSEGAQVAREYEPRVPEGVDVSRPSIARIYDYLLFGKDNFAVDRPRRRR